MKTRTIVVCLTLGAVSLVGCRQAEEPKVGADVKGVAKPEGPDIAGPQVKPGLQGTPVATGGEAKDDKAQIEAVVRGFSKAIEAIDMKKAAGFVNGGKPDGDYSSFASGIRPAKLKVGIEDLKIEVKGDHATATCTLHLDYGPKMKPMTHGDKVDLVRMSNGWLIVPAERNSVPSFFGMVSATLAHPEQARTGNSRRIEAAPITCLTNLKQIAVALLMLAADSDDVFKVTRAGWANEIMPYIKNKAVFHCPQDPASGTSYSINPEAMGKSTTQFSRPSDTVLIYEGKGMKLEFRHEGRAGVGFVDGHCKLVSREAAKRLMWKP